MSECVCVCVRVYERERGKGCVGGGVHGGNIPAVRGGGEAPGMLSLILEEGRRALGLLEK